MAAPVTPGARVQAAVEALDRIAAGEPAERVLTRWARGARHAGSKDRAAVRDHVFDALRRWWTAAALGGGEGGRARMIGLLRDLGTDPATLFTGQGYAPAPLDPAEATCPEDVQHLDVPDWLLPELDRSLGPSRDDVLAALRHRAPVFLRANLARTTPEAAAGALAEEGVATRAHPLSPTALEVVSGARRVHLSAAFRDGLVEVQDAASQAVADAVPLAGAGRVLDYCAGGGGKALAMAARHAASYHAHDADPGRMRDLPARAARAGVAIDRVATADLAHDYDVVLADAPCSGSGAWRRAPEGKIRFTPARLSELMALQDEVLAQAAARVAPGGALVYATCSLLEVENGDRVRALGAPNMRLEAERRLTPLDGGDGFYVATLRADRD